MVEKPRRLSQKLPATAVISLTATPPYDSEPELWDRYLQMCGEIDQEITVPELVKEDTLCPHQGLCLYLFSD